ncbi:MAG TPA: hypothetical protein VEL76_06180 [Gemmataceae bacterium]|nr:hypothetical protein [Gemmataceae bacterium]
MDIRELFEKACRAYQKHCRECRVDHAQPSIMYSDLDAPKGVVTLRTVNRTLASYTWDGKRLQSVQA